MPDRRARTLTLAACILGSAVIFIDQTVVNVALPAIRDDLDASLAHQQWVVEAYLLFLASLILVGGSLGDLYGRRRVFAIGVAGFGVASLVCSAAPTSGVLIAGRGLQGVFGALLVPSSLAIITATFDAEERGAAIGAWTAWTAAAVALGPPLGGVLVDTVSWRMIFALNVPLVLACLWLIHRAVPAMPGRGGGGGGPDLTGAVLCALGLGGAVYALIRQPALGWGDPGVAVPLLAGLGALAAFVAYERRARHPMLPLGIFRSRNFAVGNVATVGIYAGLGAATFFVALFLQQIAGYSATEAGLALLPLTLMLITLSRRFGALAARTGPRALMGLGPLVAGAGLLLYLPLDERGAFLTTVLPATLVFGLGMAMTVAPLTAAVLRSADADHAGVASGVNNAVARVASLLAIAAIGAVVSAQLSARLDERPAASAAARAYLDEARAHPLTLPDRPAAPAIRAQAREAGVGAFRAGMLVAALLVMAGGVAALIGIENPPRRARVGHEAQPAPAGS